MTSRRSELQALRDFFDYNTFVRKRYLSFISKLPQNLVTKDRGASFPSILDIFTHVLDVYKGWFHRYEVGGEDPPEIKGLSLLQVKKLEKEVDTDISKFMRKVNKKDLNNTFEFLWVDDSNKRHPLKRRLDNMLWHLVEEELQHRGEINALLWQDDIDPPVTSWGRWREEVAKRRVRS
jgi:uncharacterized damage-inducible protein DinB